MENFIQWVFDSFYMVIYNLTEYTVNQIADIFVSFYSGNDDLSSMTFNLSLFSDTPILTTTVYDILVLFFSILYTVILVVIVWKIIKKVIVKITRWNKW